MSSAVKQKAENTQKITALKSSIFELEKRYKETCESN